jgi:hypothetical protein
MLWLLMGYMFLFVHRPFEVWPTLGTFRIEFIYMLITGGIWIGTPGKRWIANRLHAALFIFAAAVLLCWVVSPWADDGQRVVTDWLKIMVFYILIVTVVHDEQSLQRLLFCFLCVMAVYMLHSAWEYHNGRHNYRMLTARMIGVDESCGDPNSFGASIVYALPLVIPFWLCRPSLLIRGFLVGYVVLSMGCIALTGSRSAFVGFVLVALVVILRSRWRWRLLGPALLAAPMLWFALPASFQNRFETIVHPEVGPANAQASAEIRLIGLKLGMQLFSNNPATGCGPGAWRKATHSPLESHNLYGQLIGEMGTFGILTFLGIVLMYGLNVRKIAGLYRDHPEWKGDFLHHVSQALSLAVVLLLFEGNFGHNLFRYTWLWYAGFLIITRHCVEQRLQAATATMEPGYMGGPVAAWRRRIEWTGTHA